MRLKYIEIKNFRSIKNLQIDFHRNFQILVGINESGKTNIIKAVSLLNEDIEFSKDDIRDPGHDEEPVDQSYVRFVFQLDKKIINRVINSSKTEILTSDFNVPILDIGDKSFTIEEFCKYKDEVLYVVNLIKESRGPSHWHLAGPKFRIYNNWKKVADGAQYQFTYKDKPVTLADYSIVNIDEFEDIPDQFLEELTIYDLNRIIGNHITRISSEYFPECITWKYSDDNLLPGRINLSQFIANPDICIPLKNMFSLAGYHEADNALQNASTKTNGLRNILRKVSENTTSHMKKVWPEWKKQKVILVQNGDFIEAGIEDEYNVYSLSRRSDGFKRFFTFLLTISVQNKTEEIYDNIIIIDEPDIGLHPTGIQYLREELKKIGENNFVLVSTHSIFMIDKEVIDRHLIVEKQKEITSIKRVDVSNINDEEVIYKALGYSIFDLLRPKNIIFEGWRDKRYFELFIKSKQGKKMLSNEYGSKLGLLHALGVKDIPRIANICENFSREYIIISDSDQPAKEKQRNFDGNGRWISYDDIEGIDAVTTEDFLSNKFINKAIRHVFAKNNIDNTVILENDISKGKISFIKRKLKNLNIIELSAKDLLNQVKEYCCLNAKAAYLDESYHRVCKYLLDNILA